jgi:hypothetical protein
MELENKRVVVPSDVLMQEISGEAVLLHLATEHYFSLDEVGTSMWTVLVETATLQQAYDTLLEEYNVEAEQLREDFIAFIIQLSDNHLLEIHDT